MDRWTGRVAVVTGASSGIGATVAIALANSGMIVVGLARRNALVEELTSRVTGSGSIHAVKCDMTDESQVKSAFEKIRSDFGGVDVLISNAGLFRAAYLIEDNLRPFKEILDVNLWASVVCIKEAIKDMRKRTFKGHIIIINSVLGHRIPDVPQPKLNVYPATKFALTALSQTLRQELRFHGAEIKLTNICPGLVDTPMLDAFDSGLLAPLPKLTAEEVKDAVIYALGTPENVQINDIIFEAMGPFGCPNDVQ
ncbi:farnesol dehydrogenase [Phlebotomus argentipes]|uniref:farnesol dehydrogenase n=1 Tax=Phlebotomus argentipes TaxID=94469 RepID=UPI00289323C6|nr:farnesol dehydrogenase [Phlebotomus argentipes]